MPLRDQLQDRFAVLQTKNSAGRTVLEEMLHVEGEKKGVVSGKPATGKYQLMTVSRFLGVVFGSAYKEYLPEELWDSADEGLKLSLEGKQERMKRKKQPMAEGFGARSDREGGGASGKDYVDPDETEGEEFADDA